MADLGEMLSTSQAAKALGVSEPRIRQLLAADTLPSTKTVLGRLIDPAAVEQLAAQRAAQKSAAQAATE